MKTKEQYEDEVNHIKGLHYDHLGRFTNYFHQIKMVRRLKPKTILEVGIGNGTVADYLGKYFEYSTLDIREGGDIQADIRYWKPNKKYDIIICCEVLEHLPWKDFPLALENIATGCNRAIISVPNSEKTLIDLSLKLPLIPRINIFKKIPLYPLHIYPYHLGDGHYWEIGKRTDEGRHSLRRVETIIETFFEIENSFCPQSAPKNHYFLLKSLHIEK